MAFDNSKAVDEYQTQLQILSDLCDKLSDDDELERQKKTAIRSLIRFIDSQKTHTPLAILAKVLRWTTSLVNEPSLGEQYLRTSKDIEKKYKALGEKMAWTGVAIVMLSILTSIAAVGMVALPLSPAVITIIFIGLITAAFALGVTGVDRIETANYIAEHPHPIAKAMSNFYSFFKSPINEGNEIEIRLDYSQ